MTYDGEGLAWFAPDPPQQGGREMTKSEFIGVAADGILKARGFQPDSLVPGFTRVIAVEDATAALEAVAAWDLYMAAYEHCLASESAAAGDQPYPASLHEALQKAESK